MEALHSPLSARRLAVAVITSAVCACTLLPMQVDRSATAPALSGYGRSDMAIATERRRSASAWLRRRKLSTLKIFLRGRFTGCSKATAAPRVRSGRLLELGR